MLLDHDQLAFEIGEILVSRGEKLAVSETTAGGVIAARLLSVPGASRWFECGVIPYSGPHKFPGMTIDESARAEGAVSLAWVTETALGLQRITGAAWCVAESGIAGPQTNRRSSKPAGTVVIALAGPDGVTTHNGIYPGSRIEVMQNIADAVLRFLHDTLRMTGLR